MARGWSRLWWVSVSTGPVGLARNKSLLDVFQDIVVLLVEWVHLRRSGLRSTLTELIDNVALPGSLGDPVEPPGSFPEPVGSEAFGAGATDGCPAGGVSAFTAGAGWLAFRCGVRFLPEIWPRVKPANRIAKPIPA